MKKNYDDLIKGINYRINPDGLENKVKMFSAVVSPTFLFESHKVLGSNESLFIKKAMESVNATYTTNTKLAAEKVKSWLKKEHNYSVEFEYQGSVMTNTHIIKDHDIDLVQLTAYSKGMDHSGLNNALNNPSTVKPDEYSNLQKHKNTFKKYEGSQLSDLKAIRLNSEQKLLNVYGKVDITGAKSICVNLTSPERLVDVVTAAYYKGVDYMKTNKEYRKGIQIYNKDTESLLPVDYPFWIIKRINEQDMLVNGRLKNMIRFLKNLKFESSEINNNDCVIKSYHINAICYSININDYKYAHYLDLAVILHQHLDNILENLNFRNTLKSVDGTETIFEKDTTSKIKEIQILYSDIDSILADIYLSGKLIV